MGTIYRAIISAHGACGLAHAKKGMTPRDGEIRATRESGIVGAPLRGESPQEYDARMSPSNFYCVAVTPDDELICTECGGVIKL